MYSYIHFFMLFCLNSFKYSNIITNNQRIITIFVACFE